MSSRHRPSTSADGSSTPRRLARVALVARLLGVAVCCAGLLGLAARPALAHAGSLSGSLQPVPVPFWLVIVSGGGIVGVSFLFTSLMTDHEAIRAVNARGVGVPSLPAVGDVFEPAVRWLSVAVLAVVVVVGLVGPSTPVVNLAILVVWVGWWAGYSMSIYLVADTWRLVNPWRTLAALVPVETRPYPAAYGSWPSVVALVGLVYLEVVSPLSDDPRALVAVVLAYTVVTLAGAATYGAVWFERVDPVARVFRLYGLLAPIQRTERGLTLSMPGAHLARLEAAIDRDDVAFVVALLWVTTYDGLVSTAAWVEVVGAPSTLGARAAAAVVAVVGFGVFYGVYRLAARLSRRTADSYVTVQFVSGWFAPSLLPIAAGYHLAHFLGYFLSLAPVLGTVALAPLSPPAAVPVVSLPGWFGSLQLAFVLGGHLLAMWVAHARSFDLFPGRLQPIRSQYPFVVVMIIYTMTSLWVVSQPAATL